MSKQYVCHVSGQGEKWEMMHDHKASWSVVSPLSGAAFLFPKSEYRLCPAPEEWRDVTAECELISSEDDMQHNGHVVMKHLGYRLRKVRAIVEPNQHAVTWAFIVEKRAS